MTASHHHPPVVNSRHQTWLQALALWLLGMPGVVAMAFTVRTEWLMQLSMYYQSLYLQITKGYVRLKMECKDYILAQKTAIDALRFDPKDSELNMYAILAMGFQGNLSMAQTYYTAAKPYLALEHAEVIKKYLNIK